MTLQDRALQALKDLVVGRAKIARAKDRIVVIQRLEKMAGKRYYEVLAENLSVGVRYVQK